MVRVTPARLKPVSAFIFIIYTSQENFKEKKKIIYTYDLSTDIMYNNSERTQRVHPASTPSEYTY
jgi:hypothetical protein